MKYIDSYKATKTGLYLVIFSALFFMILGIIVAIYFVKVFDFHPLLSLFLFIPLSIIIYTPFWSYILVKWKIWSFKRIVDIDILINLAEKKNLIYPDDHFYTKYEFCPKKDKEVIRELKEQKLKEDNSKILFHLLNQRK